MAEADRRAAQALTWLERKGTKKNRDGMARYAIVSDKVFGVSVADIRRYAKQLGKDHALALSLWKTGWYEARMLAAFVDVPSHVTSAQMNTWAKEFDNWAICDTVCFHLFDRTPHALKKVEQWSARRDEFVKRGAFALLASVALHDKRAPDASFTRGLELIEQAATDERNFVKKGVSWALRGIGHRNAALRASATDLARGLLKSESAAARWIARDAIKDLSRPARKRS